MSTPSATASLAAGFDALLGAHRGAAAPGSDAAALAAFVACAGATGLTLTSFALADSTPSISGTVRSRAFLLRDDQLLARNVIDPDTGSPRPTIVATDEAHRLLAPVTARDGHQPPIAYARTSRELVVGLARFKADRTGLHAAGYSREHLIGLLVKPHPASEDDGLRHDILQALHDAGGTPLTLRTLRNRLRVSVEALEDVESVSSLLPEGLVDVTFQPRKPARLTITEDGRVALRMYARPLAD